MMVCDFVHLRGQFVRHTHTKTKQQQEKNHDLFQPLMSAKVFWESSEADHA